MEAKPYFEIDGLRWVRVPHAAKMLHTTTMLIRRWMGDGTLEWRQLREGSMTFLIEEQSLTKLALERVKERQQVKRDAGVKPKRKSAPRPPAPYKYRPPSIDDPSPRGPGVFDRTWDPSPGAGVSLSKRKPLAD